MRTLTQAIVWICLLGVVACAPAAQRPAPASTITSLVTRTRPPPVAVTPLSDGPTTARDGPCPFIATGLAAEMEGNRIGRVAVLYRSGRPIGCQFFFDPHWGAPRMVLEIASAVYASDDVARDAIVQAGAGGHGAFGVVSLVPGVAAVLYRTQFYPPDGGQDWACAFATGATVVTVRTDQTNTSADARNVAEFIAPRFAPTR